jgi:peptidoglycan/LPS O-acetylase OafA/YrhL
VLTLLSLAYPLTALQRVHLPWEYAYATNFLPLTRDQVVMFWGWSLALEEQFYLLVPLLFFALRRLPGLRAQLGFLAALALLALLNRLRLYFWHGPWTDFTLYDRLYFRADTRFDALALGILLAFAEHRAGPALRRWLSAPSRRALLLLPSLGILWVLLDPGVFGPEHTKLVRVFAWGTLPSVMYLAWVPLLLHVESPVSRFLSLPFWRRAATLGYGIYLVHIPILDHAVVPIARRCRDLGVSMLWVWPISLAVLLGASAAVAYALHLAVEKPSLGLRDRLAA